MPASKIVIENCEKPTKKACGALKQGGIRNQNGRAFICTMCNATLAPDEVEAIEAKNKPQPKTEAADS